MVVDRRQRYHAGHRIDANLVVALLARNFQFQKLARVNVILVSAHVFHSCVVVRVSFEADCLKSKRIGVGQRPFLQKNISPHFVPHGNWNIRTAGRGRRLQVSSSGAKTSIATHCEGPGRKTIRRGLRVEVRSLIEQVVLATNQRISAAKPSRWSGRPDDWLRTTFFEMWPLSSGDLPSFLFGDTPCNPSVSGGREDFSGAPHGNASG